jgi:hypothetical protein
MDILAGFKLCRKGLHQYQIDLKSCPECHKINSRAAQKRYRERNPEKIKKARKKWQKERYPEWYQQNKDRQVSLQRARRQNNQEEYLNYLRNWRQNNKKRQLDLQRKWQKKNGDRNRELKRNWQKNNPEKINARTAKRRAQKKHAVAPWANDAAIKAIYKECQNLTKETGIKHEVDHVYPLQSPYMCGLHVENNLQILTETDNSKKGNRTWPDQLECQKLPINQAFTPEQIALAG